MQPFSPFYTPTPKRPLLGMTILVVEDSRYAGDGLRLMCLHSGARIRRADCLAAAYRHLRVYRPTAVIIDLGLPDGSGLDLIRDLAHQRPRIAVVLGISGDDLGSVNAIRAGADGFLSKPLKNLATFQETLLTHMPKDMLPAGPRALNEIEIEGDPSAYHDDLLHVSNLIEDSFGDPRVVDYIVQFLHSIALASEDQQISEQARQLAAAHKNNEDLSPHLSQIQSSISARFRTAPVKAEAR